VGGGYFTRTNGGIELPNLGGDEGFGVGGFADQPESCGTGVGAEEDQDGEEAEKYKNTVGTAV